MKLVLMARVRALVASELMTTTTTTPSATEMIEKKARFFRSPSF